MICNNTSATSSSFKIPLQIYWSSARHHAQTRTFTGASLKDSPPLFASITLRICASYCWFDLFIILLSHLTRLFFSTFVIYSRKSYTHKLTVVILIAYWIVRINSSNSSSKQKQYYVYDSCKMQQQSIKLITWLIPTTSNQNIQQIIINYSYV